MFFKVYLILGDYVRVYPYIINQEHILETKYVDIDCKAQMLNLLKAFLKDRYLICICMLNSVDATFLII
jgi:hypothetical protein